MSPLRREAARRARRRRGGRTRCSGSCRAGRAATSGSCCWSCLEQRVRRGAEQSSSLVIRRWPGTRRGAGSPGSRRAAPRRRRRARARSTANWCSNPQPLLAERGDAAGTRPSMLPVKFGTPPTFGDERRARAEARSRCRCRAARELEDALLAAGRRRSSAIDAVARAHVRRDDRDVDVGQAAGQALEHVHEAGSSARLACDGVHRRRVVDHEQEVDRCGSIVS